MLKTMSFLNKNKIRKGSLIMQKKNIPGILFLFIANLIWIVTFWFTKQFPDTDFSSIMFYIKVPLDGSNTSAFKNIIITCIILTPLLTTFAYLTTRMLDEEHSLELGIRKIRLRLPLNLWRRYFSVISDIFLIITTIISSYQVGLTTYLSNNLHRSSIYEEYYVDPTTASITFPETKRNLIYIFIWSLWKTLTPQRNTVVWNMKTLSQKCATCNLKTPTFLRKIRF